MHKVTYNFPLASCYFKGWCSHIVFENFSKLSPHFDPADCQNWKKYNISALYKILFFNETFLNIFSIQSMLSNSRKEWKLQMLCCLFNQLFSRFLCDITMPWNFSHGITWWHSLSFYVCSLWVAFTPPPPKPSWLIVLLAFTPFGLENEALFYFSGAWTMRSLMKLQLQLEEV